MGHSRPSTTETHRVLLLAARERDEGKEAARRRGQREGEIQQNNTEKRNGNRVDRLKKVNRGDRCFLWRSFNKKVEEAPRTPRPDTIMHWFSYQRAAWFGQEGGGYQ